MKQDIQVIRDSIGKIVSMLTSRAIKVTQRGVKAYVAYDAKSGAIKLVNVPYLPDDATPEFIAAVQGFLDHEVGHVLFTDQKVVIAASKQGARIANLANIVEDVFIERKMTEAFQGSAHNLESVRKFYLERICGKGISEALVAGDQAKAEGFAFVAAFRAWGGQTSAQDFIKQPHVAPLVDPLKAKLGDDILRKLTRVQNSGDCLDLAIEIKKALTPPPPPPPPPAAPPPPPAAPPSPQDDEDDQTDDGQDDQDDQDNAPPPGDPGDGDQDSESDDGTSADEKGDAGDDSPATPPSSGGGDDQEEDEEQDGAQPEEDEPGSDNAQGESDGQGDPADPADDGQDDDKGDGGAPSNAPADSDGEDDGSDGMQGQGDDQAPAGEDDQDDEDLAAGDGEAESGQSEAQDEAAKQGDGGTASTEAPGGSNEDAEATTKDPERDLTEIFEEKRDFDDALSEGLTKEAEHQFNSASYQIYSTEWDKIEPARESKIPSNIEELDKGTEGTLGVMQKQLERAIAAKARKSWNPAQRRGRIAPGALFKSAVGDDRLFRQRFETQAKNTAFTLLVDNSGSMVYEGNLLVAAKAAYALSQVLERIKVTHEVLGFTTYESAEMQRAMADDLTGTVTPQDYARDEAIYMPIFKGFGERLGTQVKARFASMVGYTGFCRCNIDGESVQIAAHRLKAQRAERHIMVVLSDGDPNCSPGGFANLNQLRNHTREAVKKVQASGVEVVGIGIRSAAVQSYYDKHIVLSDLKELPSVVMGQLTKMLLA